MLEYVTVFSVLITFGTPFILNYIYKLLDYKPAEVEHHFISFKQLIRKNTH